MRYRHDWVTGTRFDTLERVLGDGFIRVELAGSGHATLTDHRHPEAVDAVVGFLRERLLQRPSRRAGGWPRRPPPVHKQ